MQGTSFALFFSISPHIPPRLSVSVPYLNLECIWLKRKSYWWILSILFCLALRPLVIVECNTTYDWHSHLSIFIYLFHINIFYYICYISGTCLSPNRREKRTKTFLFSSMAWVYSHNIEVWSTIQITASLAALLSCTILWTKDLFIPIYSCFILYIMQYKI